MPTTIDLVLKHSGKTFPVTVDLDQPGLTLKQQAFELTGVPVDKVKVVVKGGMLKDDADLKKLGFKAGQTVMVIGPAGPLPQAPPKPIVFMEDMTDTELAQAVAYPPGLQNLGNTCYANSTIQVLRTIPELQEALNDPRSSPTASTSSTPQSAALTASLGQLYQSMSRTQTDFPPVMFLEMLRQFAPQFAERSRATGGYAQQDAQEAWGSIVNAVKSNNPFIEKYMVGELETTLKSAEAPDEAATSSRERFLELKCPIAASTTYMVNGINEGLTQSLEKDSPSLGRQAVYSQTSRITRLPQYLTVNFVRFYWRREIGKKTKIMKRVAFPHELDAAELPLEEGLREKIRPVGERFKEVEKDRRERAKVRRRAKVVADASAPAAVAPVQQNPEDDPAEEMLVDGPKEGELIDEDKKRQEEIAELEQLVDPTLRSDAGANVTGLYELARHYVGWAAANNGKEVEESKEEWYKFDDEKVSIVEREKIKALEGGGEDHSAYILLYRSKKF